jgi:hypothetical protein
MTTCSNKRKDEEEEEEQGGSKRTCLGNYFILGFLYFMLLLIFIN